MNACALHGVVSVLLMQTAFAVSVNDDFSQRRQLPSQEQVEEYLTVRESLAGATCEPLDPLFRSSNGTEPGGSLWWEWTAPRNGWFLAEVRTQAGDYLNTFVFEGASLDRLRPVQNGNNRGLTPAGSTVFEAKAGTRYCIAVETFSLTEFTEKTHRQSWWLRLRPSPGPPVNDTLATRAVLSGPLPITARAANLTTPSQEGHRLSNMSLMGQGYDVPSLFGPVLWWEWTCPESGPYQLKADDYNTYVFIAQRKPSTGDGPSPAGGWESSGPVVNDSFFIAQAGNTYDIAVTHPWGYDLSFSNFFGETTLRLDRPQTVPANQTRDTAALLPATVPSRTAFRWRGGLPPAGSTDYFSFWWKFTAPEYGIYRFDKEVEYSVLHDNGVEFSMAFHRSTEEAPSLERAHPLDAGETIWLELPTPPRADITTTITVEKLPVPTANDMLTQAVDLGMAADFWIHGYREMSSMEPGEPLLEVYGPALNSYGSLWWRWTAPASGRLRTIDSSGWGVVDIFTGAGIPNLSRVGSLVSLPAVAAGQTYFIRMGFSRETGPTAFSAHLDFLPRPTNTSWTVATDLGATDKPGWHPVRPYPVTVFGADRWFRWAPIHTGRYSFSISGTLAVYTGPSANEAVLRDPASLTWEVHGGQTYWLQVPDHTAATGFEIDREVLCSNGDRATALVLDAALPACSTASVRGDKNSPEEVAVLRNLAWDWLLNNGAPCIWWRWEAPRDERVRCRLDVSDGNNFNLFVFSGPMAGTDVQAQPVSTDGAGRYFRARQGETYWFAAVGGMEDAYYPHYARMELWPVVESAPTNDSFASRAEINGAEWKSHRSFQGMHRSAGGSHPLRYEWTQATLEVGEPPVSLIIGEAGNAVAQTASTWWSWTAPATGIFKINLNQGFDPGNLTRSPRTGEEGGILNDLTATLFTGDTLASLQPVMVYEPLRGEYCFHADSGVRYSIRVATGQDTDVYALQPVTPAPWDVYDFWAIDNWLFEEVGNAYGNPADDGIPNYVKLVMGLDLYSSVNDPGNAAAVASLIRPAVTPGMLEFRILPSLDLAPDGDPANYGLGGMASDDLENWYFVPAASAGPGELSVRVPMTGSRGFLKHGISDGNNFYGF